MKYFFALTSIFFFPINTFFWCVGFFFVYLLKFIVPSRHGRRFLYSALLKLAALWIRTNNLYIDWILPTKITVQVPENLSEKESYLIVSNHASWVDILMLQYALNKKTPFLRFFIKDSLRWVPLLGQAWMALDFPFMKRNSGRQKGEKNRDLAEAKRACARMLGKDVSVLIFLEGTRFTEQKRVQKNSPFKYLLPPKTGGSSAVLDVLGSQLNGIVDCTLIYRYGTKNFWHFMCGELQQVDILIQRLEVPSEFINADFENNKTHRLHLQEWALGLWSQKEKQISKQLESSLDQVPN